ncbi:adenine specific DNA methyltransferase [Candidatus Vecturithrix granuli]|uniref:site-specific DNA-methyltransferase (adenine-specific) n=1 Tax=Vecturithrix granuli TaxID=1499967 RepID=A0A081CA83_VECG1|nr:adenine specific DNA methyltransferase [Candidatus Vecturithrix granuli]
MARETRESRENSFSSFKSIARETRGTRERWIRACSSFRVFRVFRGPKIMHSEEIAKLRSLTDFHALIAYLRDELDWPIEAHDAEDLVFEYEPEELGIDKQYAVNILSIKQLRPLVDQQPWGVFYLEFERKRLPVVVLRRILRAFVAARRAVDPERPVWRLADLMFISALGETEARGISFAHFHQKDDGLPELRTFSWDQRETHFYYLKRLNLAALKWPDDESDAAAWRGQWSRAFNTPHRYSISSSQNLAKEMAKHALTVRALIDEVYALESKEGALHQLYDNFKDILLHDLTPAAFADMLAQTVAYGLLSAAAQDSQALTLDSMVAHIPQTNPFLKNLLAAIISPEDSPRNTPNTRKEEQALIHLSRVPRVSRAIDLNEENEFSRDSLDSRAIDVHEDQEFSRVPRVSRAIDLDEIGIGELVTMLQQTNVEAILRDFGRQTGSGREDPVIHFYELFLSEYDKAQKVQRGVFYTPDPVVSFIVRSVDELLKHEFGLQDGLADTSCDPDTGEPLVQILDPATGTGTFLAHVIDRIEATVKAKAKNVPGTSESAGRIDWDEYVSRHLLPRLNGFELMMAPYAVAHTKLGLKLQQTGYSFGSDERLRVFLCNALEQAVEKHDMLALRGVLSKESNEAAKVKLHKPISVIIGNPPYSVSSANKSEFIDGLMGTYKEDVKSERNIQPLSDDYVKFIRLAHWKIEKTGRGIIGMITNNSYLSGLIHRGMRKKLLESFDKIYILNLHGNSRIGEKALDGTKDENVFDIMQGVSIALFVVNKKGMGKVFYQDRFGLSDRKYEYLNQNTVVSTQWEELEVSSPYYFFVEKNFSQQESYNEFWSISEIFKQDSSGVTTHRDHFVVGYTEEEIKQRIKLFVSDLTDETLSIKLDLKETSDFKIEFARKKLKQTNWEKFIVPYLYRPFDDRYICYVPELIDRDRYDIMCHFFKENLGLAVMRQYLYESVKDYNYVLCVNNISDRRLFISNRGAGFVYPLYLYPKRAKKDLFSALEEPKKKEININPNIFKVLTEKYNAHPNPEDIFHYIYAILHSPEYRRRYAEFLKIDFPRIPFTADYGLFQQLAALGADLAALHLLQDDYAYASWTQAGQASPLHAPLTSFVEGVNGKTMGAFSKSSCYKGGRVFLDTSLKGQSSYFAGVPEDVWHFQIGGYQVCYKWLYDRRAVGKAPGRTLTDDDIAHYHKIVIALRETLRLMRRIDAVIAEHGGFPLV